MNGECETPMRDHVDRFWRTLQEGDVRILVDIRRPESFGGAGHWDSASFPNDVAKAILAERNQQTALTPDRVEAAAQAFHNEFSPAHETWASLTDQQADCYRTAVRRAFSAAGYAGAITT